jgi:hypothetical protein
VASAEDLEKTTNQLYALPLDEFTAQRDALAKQLRGDGDRDAAQQVKQLRKPNVTAWALNRLRHRDAKSIDRLIEAGARLREAQQRLLDEGDRQGLRAASARERELVEALVAEAEAELSAAGHPAGPTIRSRLFSTLHAVSGDEQARSGLAAGRLVGDHEISDLGFALGSPGEPATRTPKPPPKPPKAPRDVRREREVAAARERLEQAAASSAELQEATGAAERELKDAERRLAAAGADVTQAAGSVERARTRERKAGESVKQLQARLERLLEQT